mmetsp:Transcript_23611/g.67977  ORF Transcript_23611/g.67977 Transcript_23611/m.67977 type:complete len:233 (+) Transcript_23611:92-790(+)
MGSYCSIHNDTRDETVLVYVGANPHVIKPILWTLSGFATMLSGAAAWGIISATVVELSLASYSVVITASTIASATGSFVSATNWAMESLQNKFVVDLTKAGYTKLLPGQTYTTQRKPLGLNMRAWVIRIQRRDNCVVIQKSNASVFSSRRPGKISTYRVTDRRVFSNWRDEVIPIEFHTGNGEGGGEGRSPNDDNSRSDDEEGGFYLIRSDQDIHFREAIGEDDWIEVEKAT